MSQSGMGAVDETLKTLTPKQREVLDFILNGKTVSEIAKVIYRHPTTVSKHLSEVAKKFGFQNAEEQYFSYRWDLIEHFTEHKPDLVSPELTGGRKIEPEFPDGPVPLDSPFYIERASVENRCFKALAKPHALVRIRAPKQMGKTSLMSRALAYVAEEQETKVATWDLMGVESEICESLEKFLKSFCIGVTQQLGLENQLSDYWDADLLSSNQNCTAYFGEYILPSIQGETLMLALDDIDRMFEYKPAMDFFALLRSWHEKSKTMPLWAGLRLFLAYSTEEYAQMDINQSPLNVGQQIDMSEFTLEQVQEVAQKYGLTDRSAASRQPWESLYRMVGGHPYLVRLALYQLATEGYSLADLLQSAPTAAGIYESHLRKHWDVLDRHPDLALAMRQVVRTREPVVLSPVVKFKLHRMGLVRYVGQQVVPRCELYRLYFDSVLGA